MKLESQNILFFLRAPQHGGTENVVLQLCEIFHPLVNKIVVVSADGFEVEKLKPYGIKHYRIPDIESKSLKTILAVSKKIKKIVKKEHITVIHTHHRMAAFYVRLLGLYRSCVFINTSHNTFYNRRFLTNFAYKKANKIACGEHVKMNLVNTYGLDNVSVIHNAVKTYDGILIPDETLINDKKDGCYLVANIGRLSKQKGMDYFIQAIPMVIERHPKTKFYIIGAGEEEKILKKMSEGLPVKYLGYRNDIQNIVSQIDLVVLTSLWEGLPLVPIETFSVGKTIVATSVDGTVEIVKDKQNGLLVEPRDSRAVAEGINWMIEHPEEQKQMEVKAKETFDMNYSFDFFSQSYVRYYRSL